MTEQETAQALSAIATRLDQIDQTLAQLHQSVVDRPLGPPTNRNRRTNSVDTLGDVLAHILDQLDELAPRN